MKVIQRFMIHMHTSLRKCIQKTLFAKNDESKARESDQRNEILVVNSMAYISWK